MLRAETAMHAAPPASYKRKIQRAPDCRASERNQSPNPLFHGLGANRCGDDVQAFGGNIFHPPEVWNPQAVLVGKSAPEMFRINFDRTKSSEDTKAQKPLEGTSRHRSLGRIV